MKKNSQQSLATKSLFIKEIGRLDSKIDLSTARLDKKIDNVALSLIKTQKDVEEIKRSMATKDDVNRIIDRIDAFAHRVVVFNRKVVVHDHRINELEPVVADHEKRLSAMEKRF